jgi:hypothetical protein
MKLFEVIFWGSRGNGDAADTIYLVRAPDFRAAVADVQRNASPRDHNQERSPLAQVVYEIGTDSSPYAESHPQILRGPYFAFAFNRGWRAWHRKMAGSSYTHEWEEEVHAGEATFPITHLMQQNEIAIPILPSRSLTDTLAFFRQFGFAGGIHSHGDYAIIRRGAVELHFFTHRELVPAESSAMCYIRVSDVEDIYRAFASAEWPRRGLPRMDDLEDKPWGMREFAVVDSDGNLLRIGQTL